MKIKNKHIYLFMVLFTVVVIVFWFYYVEQTSHLKSQKNKKHFSNFNDQVLSDKEKIKIWVKNQNLETSFKDLANSLVRVAQSGDVKTEDWMVLFSKHKSSDLKIGAAKAAGYIKNDKSLSILKSLANDADVEVRSVALRAIGNHSSPEAKSWLGSKGKEKFNSKKEHVEWLGTQLKQSSNNKNIHELSKYILSTNNNNKVNIQLQRLAFERLLVGAPKSFKTQEVLQKIIYLELDSKMMAASIRHLAIIQDKWLNSSLKLLLKHKDKNVRVASVQSIHRLCPLNRWDMIYDVWNKDSLALRKVVLKEVQVLPGPEANNFLKNIKSSITPELKDLFKITKQKLQKRSTYNNPCKR